MSPKNFERSINWLGFGLISATTLVVASLAWQDLSRNQFAMAQTVPLTTFNKSFGCGPGTDSDDFSTYVHPSNSAKELHLIGIYEATNKDSNKPHAHGKIKVNIQRSYKPIILALSAYEPITWEVNLGPGVKVEKIVVNGYYDQTISGVQGIPIENYIYAQNRDHLGAFTYEWGKADKWEKRSPIEKQMEKLTGLSLTSFQGCYNGASFEIK